MGESKRRKKLEPSYGKPTFFGDMRNDVRSQEELAIAICITFANYLREKYGIEFDTFGFKYWLFADGAN